MTDANDAKKKSDVSDLSKVLYFRQESSESKNHQIGEIHLMEKFSFRNFRIPTHDTQLTPILEFINFRFPTKKMSNLRR